MSMGGKNRVDVSVSRVDVFTSNKRAFLRLPDVRFPAKVPHLFVNDRWGGGIYNPFFGIAVTPNGMGFERILQELLGGAADACHLISLHAEIRPVPTPFLSPPGKRHKMVQFGKRPIVAREIGVVRSPNMWDNPVLSAISAERLHVRPGADVRDRYFLAAVIRWGTTIIHNPIADLSESDVLRYGLDDTAFRFAVPRQWIRPGDRVFVVTIGDGARSRTHLVIGGHAGEVAGARMMVFAFSVQKNDSETPWEEME